MNLAKKYKQLFEGKIRSNDSILLMERNYGPMDKWNNDLQGVYDQMSGIDKDFQSTISLSAFSKTSDTTGLNPENAYDHAVKWLDKGKELSPEELAKVRTDNAAYGEAYDAYFKAVQEKDPKQKNAGIVLFMLAFFHRFKKDKEMGIMRDIFVTATQNALKGDSAAPAAGGVFDHVISEEELDIEDLTDPDSIEKLAAKL